MAENEKRHLDEDGAAPGPPQEDEIDLADLARVLVLRWRWIVGFTILAVLVGTGYSFLQPSIYTFTSTLQIGEYQTAEGGYRFIQSPKNATKQIETIAYTLYEQPQGTGNRTRRGFSIQEDFQVSSLGQGGIIQLELRAGKDSKAPAFLNSVMNKLSADHEQLYQAKRNNYQHRIQRNQTQIKAMRQRIKRYTQRLHALDKHGTYLKKRISEVNQRIDRLVQIKATAGFDNTKDSIGLLLFNSEIQRIRAHTDTLRNRLISEIPEKRQTLLTDRESLQSRITTYKSELEEQKAILRSMSKTQVLREPVRSGPVAPNHKLHIALSLVLGAFLGVFLAFLVEFWQRNKDRILQKETH